MSKYANKKTRRMFLQGFLAFNKSKFRTQNEIDLATVKEINEKAINGKIAVLNNTQCYYDSHDYNVQGYSLKHTSVIDANYSSYRLFLKNAEDGADAPFHVEIVKPNREERI